MSKEKPSHNIFVEIQKETHSDTVMIRMLQKENSVLNPQPNVVEIGDIEYVLAKAQETLRSQLGNYTSVMNNDLCEIGFDFAIEIDLNDHMNNHRTNNYSRERQKNDNATGAV